MELLAPAGSPEAFFAAVEAGADAVYMGVPGCNARSLAREMSWEELAWLAREARRRGVALHLAMNAAVLERELADMAGMLARAAALEPAALIVQDLGLMDLAARHFPELNLHASTLCSVHNRAAARALARLGVSRVVLARELDIEEIGLICADCREAGVEVEVFAHGAMCFSFSGLCLFSSLHGGRSSLRGRCVQPCRRLYGRQGSGTRQGGKQGGRQRGGRHGGQAGRQGGAPRSVPGGGGSPGYFFSMNDLQGLELLPELARAGVRCLKIEGRLRTASYVRHAVRAYRLVLDAMAASADGRPAPQVLARARDLLARAMGRSAGPAFLSGRAADRARAVQPGRSGSTGAYLGRGRAVGPKGGRGGPRVEISLRHAISRKDRLRVLERQSGSGQAFSLALMRQRGRTLGQAPAGARVEIELPPGLSGEVDLFLVEQARDRTRTERGRLSLAWSGKRAARARGDLDGRQPAPRRRQPDWWLALGSATDLGLRPPVPVKARILPLNQANLDLLGRRRRLPRDLVLALPPLVLPAEEDWHCQAIARLHQQGQQAFLLGHVGQVEWFQGLDPRPRLHAGHTCNVFNSQTAACLSGLGLVSAIASLECGRDELAALCARSPLPVGVVVHARPALFTSRMDAPHLRAGTRVRSPRGEELRISRAQGLTLVHGDRPYSLLPRLNEVRALHPAFLVLDLSGGPARRELALAASLLRGRDGIPVMEGNFSKGLS